MDISTQSALEQLDAVIAQAREGKLGSPAEASGLKNTRMRAVIRRLAPPGSPYIAESNTTNEFVLLGVVTALREDYAAGFMKTYQQLINSDLFSDFLEMARYLLQEENLKQPSAVLAGGVLEEHIRKLCDSSGILTDDVGKPKKVDTMNAELAKANVYGKNDQKQITAWSGIRNSAAHAKYDEFDEFQVKNMIDGIRAFITRFPA